MILISIFLCAFRLFTSFCLTILQFALYASFRNPSVKDKPHHLALSAKLSFFIFSAFHFPVFFFLYFNFTNDKRNYSINKTIDDCSSIVLLPVGLHLFDDFFYFFVRNQLNGLVRGKGGHIHKGTKFQIPRQTQGFL